jgi:hypothetical protein
VDAWNLSPINSWKRPSSHRFTVATGIIPGMTLKFVRFLFSLISANFEMSRNAKEDLFSLSHLPTIPKIYQRVDCHKSGLPPFLELSPMYGSLCQQLSVRVPRTGGMVGLLCAKFPALCMLCVGLRRCVPALLVRDGD